MVLCNNRALDVLGQFIRLVSHTGGNVLYSLGGWHEQLRPMPEGSLSKLICGIAEFLNQLQQALVLIDYADVSGVGVC
ncbi:MAG: hypothetical protein ABF420_11450 [Acetobacter syzygii]